MRLFGEDLLVSEIRADKIRKKRDEFLLEPVKSQSKDGEDKKRSTVGVNTALRALMTLLNYAFYEGIIDNNDYKRVKKLKELPKERKWWSEEESKKVIKSAKNISIDALIFVSLGIYTGMRRMEIDNLKWSDINMDNKQWILHVAYAKGGKQRYIPVCEELEGILKAIKKKEGFVLRPSREKIGKSKYRFHPEKTLQNVIKHSGVKKINIHGMRHTFATLMLHKDISVYLVSRWLGHSTTTTTELHYAHMVAKNDQINKLKLL